jgi:serine/threonine protein kinase
MQDQPLASFSADTEQSGERHFAKLDPRLEHLPPHLEVRRVLGEGGSSVVYEAFHARLKVLVAVKVLSVHSPQARQRMLREAELYALLDDPRIPRVYDVNDLPDGMPYVVMEMVPGQSLEDLLKRGALAPKLAISITKQVLETLASVHARGVLHRDVKPANVILNFQPDETCQVRLVDFGIAKMSTNVAGQEAVTQRGSLVGTPQYMAPERLVGEEADGSADTYAAGVMLYEMLAGVPPFEGTSVSAIVVAVLREQPMPLLARCPDVSPALDQFITRAMAREPAQRFSSASAMLEALSAIERGLTMEVSVLGPESGQASRRSDAWRLRLLLLALLVVVLAGSVAWLERAHIDVASVLANQPLQESAPATSAVPAAGLRVAPIEQKPEQQPATPPQAAAEPDENTGYQAESSQPANDYEQAPPSAQDREQALRPPISEVVTTPSTPEQAQPTTPEPALPEPAPPATFEQATPPATFEEVPERPGRRARRTTIDYAELLPDNPY